MRGRILVLAALACTAASPVATSADDAFITNLLDKMTEVYADKGYTATGYQYQGAMNQGQEQVLNIPLSGGTDFQIMGACNSNCGNMDIELRDASGTLVDKDELEDDFPIVGASAPGAYTARVIMTDCTANPCSYGVKAFRK